jgi:hypothetical protein
MARGVLYRRQRGAEGPRPHVADLLSAAGAGRRIYEDGARNREAVAAAVVGARSESRLFTMKNKLARVKKTVLLWPKNKHYSTEKM